MILWKRSPPSDAFSSLTEGVSCLSLHWIFHLFMPWMKSPALVILSLLFAAAVYGNIDYEDARRERRLKPAKTGEKITIDGRLDEPAWNQIPAAATFIQNDPQEDQPASEKTEVRVLYDQESLYFGVYAHDSEPKRVII